MKKKALIILFLVYASISFAQKQGQQKIDSLIGLLPTMKNDSNKVNVLKKIADGLFNSSPNNAINYIEQAISTAKKINWDIGIAKTNFQKGTYFFKIGKYVEAIKCFEISKLIYLKNGEFKKLKNVFDNLGFVYVYQSKFGLALNEYFNGLKIAEKLKDKREIASSNINLAGGYYSVKQYAKSIEYYKEGIKLSKEINDHGKVAQGLSNLGNVYYRLENYELYLQVNLEALEIAKSINYEVGIAHINSSIGLSYSMLKRYDKSIKALEIANVFFESRNDFSSLGFNYNVLAKNYLEIYSSGSLVFLKSLNITKEQCSQFAFDYIKKALDISLKSNDYQMIRNDYEALSGYYNVVGDYKKALEFSQKVTLYRDSMYLASDKETIKNLEDKRTIELKTKEIEINGLKLKANENELNQQHLILELNQAKLLQSNKDRDLGDLRFKQSQTQLKNEQLQKIAKDKQLVLTAKENQLNKLSLKAKERQKWYYLCGLALLLFIGGLLFYQSRARKKLNTQLLVFNNELDQANKVKTRFFSILNHDLRSPVANLIHFLHLQKEAPEMLSATDKQRLETKTINSTENLLQSMEDLLLWSKGQMENFKPSIKNVAIKNLFDDTAKHFSGVEDVALLFENPEGVNLTTDEDYLKTIMRNLTSNAIKALSETPHAQIIWKAWQENGLSYLSITDNGPGATAEQFKALYDDKEVVGIKSGLGLHLIRDLAKAISCKISVDTKVGGTTFLLAI